MKTLHQPPPLEFDLLDLRDCTRNSSRTLCEILVETRGSDGLPEMKPWIKAGAVSFREDRDGVTTVFAFFDREATDFEHDSAKAFSLEVIGLRFERLDYGRSFFSAFIRPHPGYDLQFRVPEAGKDPFEGSSMCSDCAKPHPILERFLPEPNAALYEKLRGVRVEIRVGPGSR